MRLRHLGGAVREVREVRARVGRSGCSAGVGRSSHGGTFKVECPGLQVEVVVVERSESNAAAGACAGVCSCVCAQLCV